jgi:predicted Na+-dependent transporter
MSAPADAAGGKQSRRMSLFEAITNVVVGYSLAVATQFAVFPLFGLEVTLAQNLLMGSLFTGISLLGFQPSARTPCVGC